MYRRPAIPGENASNMGKIDERKGHSFFKRQHVVRQGRNDVAKKEMRILRTKCRKSGKQNRSRYSRTTTRPTTKLQARHNSSTARVQARAFLRMEPQNGFNSHRGHVISFGCRILKDISSATTVTTVTTVTFSLGCKSPSFCMALSVLLKLTTSTWAPVKRSSGTRHHGKNHSYQIQQR